MGDGINIFEIVPAVCALVSFWHCFWLIGVSMPKLRLRDRRNLLLRQLWHIAVADMVSSVGSLGLFVLSEVPLYTSQAWCYVAQYSVWALFLLSLGVSILVQGHFTIGLLLSLRRWRRAMAALQRSLPFMILPAACVCAMDVWYTASVFDMSPDGCVWVTKRDGHLRSGLVTAVVAMAVIAMNMIVYLLLLLEETRCGDVCMPSVVIPGSVGIRVLNQARRYMLVTICTWLPYWLLAATGQTVTLTWAENPWQMITAAGVTLNGAMNVWSYALHNRHIRRSLAADSLDESASELSIQQRQVGITDSHHVAFETNLEVREVGGTSTSEGSGQEADWQHGGMVNHAGEDPLGFFFATQRQ